MLTIELLAILITIVILFFFGRKERIKYIENNQKQIKEMNTLTSDILKELKIIKIYIKNNGVNQ